MKYLPGHGLVGLRPLPRPRGMEEETGGLMDWIFSGSSGHFHNRFILSSDTIMIQFHNALPETGRSWKILYLSCHSLTTVLLYTVTPHSSLPSNIKPSSPSPLQMQEGS